MIRPSDTQENRIECIYLNNLKSIWWYIRKKVTARHRPFHCLKQSNSWVTPLKQIQNEWKNKWHTSETLSAFPILPLHKKAADLNSWWCTRYITNMCLDKVQCLSGLLDIQHKMAQCPHILVLLGDHEAKLLFKEIKKKQRQMVLLLCCSFP